MVGNSCERRVQVARPQAVKGVGARVVAEPVTACQPDLLAAAVNDFVALDKQPVIGGGSGNVLCGNDRCAVVADTLVTARISAV